MANPPCTINPFCWILNKSKRAFPVDIEDNLTVDELKDAILKEKPNALHYFDAAQLRLWKVPVSIDEDDEINDEKLKNKRGNQKPLHPMMALSDVFSQPPLVHESYIIVVELPHSENTPPSPPENAARRTATVSGLYARLQKYCLIQVRGTPGSGKTTLGMLLAEHIKNKEPNVNIVWVAEWQREEVERHGGYLGYLRHKGWTDGEETVFIFDEAQTTYWDSELWISLFKNLADYDKLRAILFASYGSPTFPIIFGGTCSRFRIFFKDEQRVTLKAIHHDDHLPAVGLLFTEDELHELISQSFSGPEYYFDDSFYHQLFHLYDGHVGAMCAFVTVIAAHESYRSLKGTTELYTWDRFLKMVGPRELFKKLVNTTIFARGLPEDKDLQDIAIARVFSKVLVNKFITTDYPHDRDHALETCFRNGWLHTDRWQGDKIVYFFASPLHRWCVEWKIWANYPNGLRPENSELNV